MLNELNAQLIVIKEKLNRKRKLENDIILSNTKISGENIRKAKLRKILDKEFADVEKLEGLSLTAIFQTILGSKEKQLEKERQELLRAKLSYDECDNGIASLIAQNSKLRNQLKEFDNVELDYRLILNAKEDFILTQQNSEIAQKLFYLSEQFADNNSKLKELLEAIQAGQIVIGEIANVIASLQKAKNWGTWDMFGGGIIATSIKHSHIDKSRNASYRVQQAIRNFEIELKDVNIQTNISADIGSFLTFADYFFDGLITDWIVQDKIQNALNRTFYLKEYIQNILLKLNDDYKKTKIVQEKCYQDRLEIIEIAK